MFVLWPYQPFIFSSVFRHFIWYLSPLISKVKMHLSIFIVDNYSQLNVFFTYKLHLCYVHIVYYRFQLAANPPGHGLYIHPTGWFWSGFLYIALHSSGPSIFSAWGNQSWLVLLPLGIHENKSSRSKLYKSLNCTRHDAIIKIKYINNVQWYRGLRPSF